MIADRLIPKPASTRPANGCFVLSPRTVIAAAGKHAHQRAEQLVKMLAPAIGHKLRIAAATPRSNYISLKIDPQLKESSPEGYRCQIKKDAVHLRATTTAGLYWGLQTLRQLLPPQIFSPIPVQDVLWKMPCQTIEDHPRFPWRGMMLDCARHFMPIEFIFKWIDLLAIHKLNIFHWHLTDDQGWRIEIKKHPRLTKIGAWRKQTLIGHALSKETHTYDNKPHGGFYTHEQIKAVVKYAAARNITVVPEIELPGHSTAAIAAYPRLGNTGKQIQVWNSWGVNPNILNVDPSTIHFYHDVLTEVMQLFPSPWIHIGGDEAPKDQWKTSPGAQSRMADLKLPDEHHLQSWFIRQMDEFLTAHGRKLIGWDEILEGGLAPGATVMSWRGEEGGIAAANAGHDVVMSPQKQVYFDHYQTKDTQTEPLAIGGFTPIEQVYQYDPMPHGLSESASRHIQGAQGQLWTEYIPNPAHAEYMTFPRLCALSEVLWSPKQPRDYSEFLPRLRVHLQRLKFLDVNFHPLDS